MAENTLEDHCDVKVTIHSTEEDFTPHDYTNFLQKMRLMGIPFSFSGNKEK